MLMNIKVAIYVFIKHTLLRDVRYSVVPQSKCVSGKAIGEDQMNSSTAVMRIDVRTVYTYVQSL